MKMHGQNSYPDMNLSFGAQFMKCLASFIPEANLSEILYLYFSHISHLTHQQFLMAWLSKYIQTLTTDELAFI